MRDYKLTQKNWPPHGQKRGGRKVFWRLVGLVTILALTYAIFDWFSTHSNGARPDTGPEHEQQMDTRVIPLTIPPNRLDGTSSTPPGLDTTNNERS